MSKYVRIILFLGSFFGVLHGLIASSVKKEDIILKHIEAYGGEENWKKVKALELKGQFTAFSMVQDFHVVKTNEGWFYSSYHHGKHPIQEWYDGHAFWTIDPWQGFDFSRRMNTHEQHVIMQKAELFSPFYRWEERGFLVVFKGIEEVDGIEVYALSLTRPGMSEEIWYLDRETFLVYKSITPWVDFSYPQTAETLYDDYRTVAGILLPHYIEQTFSTRHRITEIEEVSINPEFSTELFRKPACQNMQKLTFMEGQWNMKVERMTRSGQWRTFDSVQVEINSPLHNILETRWAYEVFFPVLTQLNINFNLRREVYQMWVHDEHGSVSRILEGTFEDGNLVLHNVPAAIPEDSNAVTYEKYIISKQNSNHFELMKQNTTDNGKTWQPWEKLNFTKP